MENLNNELLEKAKQAKSAEELLVLAKENGVELTEEQAKAYYVQLHPVSGEIADDELENVAGGGCHVDDGRLWVSSSYHCEHFSDIVTKKTIHEQSYHLNCRMCEYYSKSNIIAYGYCNHPANNNKT